MKSRFRPLVLVAAVAAALAFAITPAGAVSVQEDSLPPAAINNPSISLSIITALPEVIQNDPDVIIAEDFVPGPSIYPDGTPVEGQSSVNSRAARACGGSAAAGLAGAWGVISYSNCNVWGSPGWTQGYAWNSMDPARSVCVQGRGFNASGVGTWYGIGCGSSATVEVPWGNILATPQVRAMSNAVLLGNTVSWRH